MEIRGEEIANIGTHIRANREANINPIDIIRILRSAGGALLMQAELHAQLVRIEWAEQKRRIVKMLVAMLFGFISLLCVMIFAGVFVLASSWETEYRTIALLGVIGFYVMVAVIAWFYLGVLWARSSEAFASCRAELAEDFALLKSKL